MPDGHAGVSSKRNVRIGRQTSLAGSLVGALTSQSLATTIITKGVPVQYTLVVKAVVVVIVRPLQSEEFRRAPPLGRRQPAAG